MKHTAMKTTLKLLFIGIMTGTMCSCSDKVDDEHGDEEKVSIYTAPEQAFAAVDVLYRAGAPTFYGESNPQDGPAAALGGFLSGFFDNEAKAEARLCAYSQQLSIDPTNIADYLDKIWDKSYQAINSANEAIDNIPYTKELTPEQEARLTAESCFFRAFNYFYLAKAFGGVPLVESSETEAAEESMPRASLQEVYQLIVSDLQTSIPNLPDTAFTDNNFRISRTTAETLLADVYLAMSGYPLKQNYYKQAAEWAKEVINSGKHRLTPNGLTRETSAYNVLRTENLNTEYIYSYQTRERKADESVAALSFSKDAANWGILKAKKTNNAYRPTRTLLNLYDSVYDTRMHEQQFFHTFFRYEKEGRTVIQTFPHASYMWFDREAMQESGISKKDIIIYRYAEVLLIAAEAIAQSEGVTAEAIGYLADVRARAYSTTDKNEIIKQLAELDKEKFIEQVWLERIREFPFEMKVWTDIQRTRRYPVVSMAEGEKVITFRDIIGMANPWGAAFTEKHLLLPISQNKLSKNVLLEQNPGYK